VYNDSHKELKSTGLGGRKPMTKGRKTTFDERLEIIQYCIANGRNYGAAMDKYKVSYQQIYLWVKKYNEKGIDGLLDRRGKAKPEFELTKADRLRAENKMLEAKNVELEMENRLLKKMQEVERRRR
jgi:transposase